MSTTYEPVVRDKRQSNSVKWNIMFPSEQVCHKIKRCIASNKDILHICILSWPHKYAICSCYRIHYSNNYKDASLSFNKSCHPIFSPFPFLHYTDPHYAPHYLWINEHTIYTAHHRTSESLHTINTVSYGSTVDQSRAHVSNYETGFFFASMYGQVYSICVHG